MNIENFDGYYLNNLNKINILLGKNGCGKSTLLRAVKRGIEVTPDRFGRSSYVIPERGGALSYEAGLEQNFYTNRDWLTNERRGNQQGNFRQQSTAQFSRLERLVLREFADDQNKEKFDVYIDKINSLLDNIYIEQADVAFKIFDKLSNVELTPNDISSGESELISLGIEVLSFGKECVSGKENMLFLDEPDVHLHPDLQVRLMHFLLDLVTTVNAKIIISTHSTAILGALDNYEYIHVAFMQKGIKNLTFESVTEAYKKVLPVFGAHPLSNIFNQAPVLILEGEDDERIWQKAVRSSNGAIKVYPCSTDEGISRVQEFEEDAEKIISAVYENARAFSLIDRDDADVSVELEDLPHVIRLRLYCRAAENLILADEVLQSVGKNWNEARQLFDTWLSINNAHVHYQFMKDFKDGGYDRKNFSIKEIRNDIMGIFGISKPWEVLVGQVIASLSWSTDTNFSSNDSILSYLGEKTVRNILPQT